MSIKNIIAFRCPDCQRGDLDEDTDSESDAIFMCTYCGATFPIINGIPRLTALENYSESFGFQWSLHQLTQLDSYTNKKISEDRLIRVTTWANLSEVSGDILEAGSGAGRFTEILLKTSARICSFDYSTAVDVNAKNNNFSDKLSLFQGDIFNLPFHDNIFDHVLCLGVLQHTPDPEKAFLSLAQKVKPGGYLYVDNYALTWHHWAQWKYLLRPFTKRLKPETLYNLVSNIVPKLMPVAKLSKMLFGRIGRRLMPIVEFSHRGLSGKINREWSILDTFDMYSPEHDHPKTINTVRRWFKKISFEEIEIFYGDNGIVGRGRKPLKNN